MSTQIWRTSLAASYNLVDEPSWREKHLGSPGPPRKNRRLLVDLVPLGLPVRSRTPPVHISFFASKDHEVDHPVITVVVESFVIRNGKDFSSLPPIP